MTKRKLMHEKFYASDGKIYTIIYEIDEDEINKFSKEEIRQMKERQRRSAEYYIESKICNSQPRLKKEKQLDYEDMWNELYKKLDFLSGDARYKGAKLKMDGIKQRHLSK